MSNPQGLKTTDDVGTPTDDVGTPTDDVGTPHSLRVKMAFSLEEAILEARGFFTVTTGLAVDCKALFGQSKSGPGLKSKLINDRL
jgi:hypothetical protein